MRDKQGTIDSRTVFDQKQSTDRPFSHGDVSFLFSFRKDAFSIGDFPLSREFVQVVELDHDNLVAMDSSSSIVDLPKVIIPCSIDAYAFFSMKAGKKNAEVVHLGGFTIYLARSH